MSDTTLVLPNKTYVWIQEGGPGNAYALAPAGTTVSAIPGGGAQYTRNRVRDYRRGAGNYKSMRMVQSGDAEPYNGNIRANRTVRSKLRQIARRSGAFSIMLTAREIGDPSPAAFDAASLVVEAYPLSITQSGDLAVGNTGATPEMLDDLPFTAADFIDLNNLVHGNSSGSVTTLAIHAVLDIGIRYAGGSAGIPNDGDREFLIGTAAGTTPTAPRLIYTRDSFVSSTTSNVTGLASGKITTIARALDLILVGGDGAAGGIYYAKLDDIKAGSAVFTQALGAAPCVKRIVMINPMEGFAVGSSADTGGNQRIWMTKDGGYTWTTLLGGSTAGSVDAVAFSDESAVWFGASDGTLRVYRNKTALSTVTISGVTSVTAIVALACPDMRANEVYVAAQSGRIIRTRNANDNTVVWEELQFDKPASSTIVDITFAGPMGCTFWAIQSNGSSQSRVLVDRSGGFMSNFAVAIGTFTSPANAAFTAFAVIDPNTAMVVGNVQDSVGFIGSIA